MRKSDRGKIVEYLEKGPTFYNFSSDRKVSGRKSYSFLKDYVRPRLEEGMKVLDLGCGDGETLSAISDTVVKGYGIEMDEERYRMAVQENKDNDNIELLKESDNGLNAPGLADRMDFGRTRASEYLNEMEREGVVTSERRGRSKYYRLDL